ncbi:MAG: UDP-N-acetylmuramate dehydrogenase [Gemmatimonadales bacterium]|nr:UDP-N-acetylmuramate dehydrogenase [Gemmatimonadales bacterium]
MGRLTARDPAWAARLREVVRGEVREGEALARHSTFRIGGPATVLLPAAADDVAAALRLCAEVGVPWFALGLGSNLLFPDEGLDALVVRLGKGLDRLERDGTSWRIGAGLPGPIAARKTAAAGQAGLHRFVGVPGSVGGGVFMNAGCHGAEWAEVVTDVTVLDAAGHDRVLPRAAVPFAYRHSGLEGHVVVETTVALREEDPAVLTAETEELFEWRERGTPFNQPCCGSTFRNPDGPSWQRAALHEAGGPRTAGQLIEAAGLKGLRVGAIEVSRVHANYFVNTGGGTANQVRTLMRKVQRDVHDRFGAWLEPEVKLVGPDGALLADAPPAEA